VSAVLAPVEHVLNTLTDFTNPPTAAELVQRVVQVGRYGSRDAQRAVQVALDRGLITLGAGLRLQAAPPLPAAAEQGSKVA
jgi:hypothetical protein